MCLIGINKMRCANECQTNANIINYIKLSNKKYI